MASQENGQHIKAETQVPAPDASQTQVSIGRAVALDAYPYISGPIWRRPGINGVLEEALRRKVTSRETLQNQRNARVRRSPKGGF